ncbi:hypothetical protein J9303_00490 [Bacillaceae bacterium Marseille-Q3522]|nr:hypothetical protein [Bacillaceae bacterium Marseille-Q3522]
METKRSVTTTENENSSEIVNIPPRFTLEELLCSRSFTKIEKDQLPAVLDASKTYTLEEATDLLKREQRRAIK